LGTNLCLVDNKKYIWLVWNEVQTYALLITKKIWLVWNEGIENVGTKRNTKMTCSVCGKTEELKTQE
jgi:hypothetical protein